MKNLKNISPIAIITVLLATLRDLFFSVFSFIYRKLSFAFMYLVYGREFDISESGELRRYNGWVSGYTHVVIPSSVTSIGEDAFWGCSGLTSVTIPDSVTSIGNWAFSGCAGLTQVIIPGSVTSIGNGAFYNCSGLTEVIIPGSVTSIGNGAFDGCAGLRSVTIPDSVTSIGTWAFSDCPGLTSVIIPDSVTSIGNNAFQFCTGLTQVTIQGSVTSIGDEAFRGCRGLTSVIIPDSVTSIGDGAFEGCAGLTQVTIPGSVTSIGWGVFSGCIALQNRFVSITTTQLAHQINQPSLMLEEVSDNASQIIPIVMQSYVYQYLSRTLNIARLVVQRLQVADVIALPPSYAYTGLKERIHTFLLCMKRIANDKDNSIEALPDDLVGIIFDSRILVGKTFSIDSDSEKLVEEASLASRSAFLMNGQ
jgi:hypothetical protein